MWNNFVNAWWSLVFYPASDAPKFRKGMIAMIAICIATLLVTYLVYYLERREWAIRDRNTDKEQEVRSEVEDKKGED